MATILYVGFEIVKVDNKSELVLFLTFWGPPKIPRVTFALSCSSKLVIYDQNI